MELNASERPENKMGIMPVNRLLISMSVPMMLSMLVQALYNVVDSMFVARVSENALTAVSLAYPMQNLMISLGIGTCVGVNALLSRSLGEQEFERANKTANNAVFLGVMNYILFALIGFFAISFYFHSQTDISEIIDYGCNYLFVCCVFSFGFFGQVTFARLLQSTGKTNFCMIIQLTGALINLLLDPIFIFGKFGFPRLEVTGAAIATVIGQNIAMLLGICFNLLFNKEIKLSLRSMIRPDADIIKRIYSVGIPSIAMNSISSIMTFGMNKILISFSSTATALFGAYFKLQSFVFMPVIGLNNGMVPIIAYNYGAKKKERIIATYKLAVIYAISILLIGLLIFQLIPDKLLLLFNASDEMLAIGIPALRTISLSYLFPGFCIISLSTFQALGHGIKAFFVSLIRQLVFLLPIAYFLSLSGKLELVWYAFPAAEIVAAVMCIFILISVYRQDIEPIPEQV